MFFAFNSGKIVILPIVKPYTFIFNLLLSVLFVMTPILGLSFEINHERATMANCCSMESNASKMSCHEEMPQSNEKEDNHKSCSDKCKDNCNNQAYHVLVLTIQNPKLTTGDQSDTNLYRNSQNSYYKEFALQNFIDQFWNPPKVA